MAEGHEDGSKLARKAVPRKIFATQDAACSGLRTYRMACPLCGDPCHCSATGSSSAGERVSVLIDPDVNQISASRISVSQTATATADPDFYRPHENSEWRDEIAIRVQAHKARRRRRFDPDASLSFGFEAETQVANEEETRAPQRYARIEVQPQADQDFNPQPDQFAEGSVFESQSQEFQPEAFGPVQSTPPPRMYRRLPVDEETGNVIEFPRSAMMQSLFADELAEPILQSPRILEAEPQPEVVVSPLATIRLDEEFEKQSPEWARDYSPGYDLSELQLPLQVAPLRPRFISALIDTSLVLTATALFCVIVLSITKFVPQGKAALGSTLLLVAAFWLCYHYLFLIYCGLTPGMEVAQLELCSFEGCYPLRKTRGGRAFAMAVSCMSLGLGFAWTLVDEDSLSWHDRITRTYLRQS